MQRLPVADSRVSQPATGGREKPVINPARRTGFDLQRFRAPARTDRPGIRWWWQTRVPAAELVRELRAIHDAGFGEVEIAFSPGFWADDPQRSALRAVLTEAAGLGIGVAMTLGAAWPLQTPNTTAGTEHAAQELQYGVSYVPNGFQGSVRIPAPFDDPAGTRRARLVAATAARVITRGPGPRIVTVSDWSGPQDKIDNPSHSTILDSKQLIDLSGEILDGSVEFTAPTTGDWAVFGYWMRDTRQGATSFIDRSAAVAATEYLDEHQIGEDNAALLPDVGTELFEDSLELNADSLFWTADILTRFRDLHGYDPTPFLPVFFAHGMCRYWVPNEEPTPDFELDTDVGHRIRRDYYRLVTELYITDHLLVLQAWSGTHSLTHKAQVAYGQNLEAVRSNREFVRHGGRAEAESLNSGDRAPMSRDQLSWRFALDWQRAVVGGAHQGGAVRISTELGAQFLSGYAFSLGDYKQMLDKEWAVGITKPFVHGFASQEDSETWPSQSRFQHYISDSWNDRHFPEWQNWSALTDYWARGTVALETGSPRTDVAIYREGFLTTAARGTPENDRTTPDRLVDGSPLEDAGYSFQFIDPTGLLDPQAADGNDTLFPLGPAYRAIVIDERTLAADAAEGLQRIATAGLRVVIVGDSPRGDSGYADPINGPDRVRTVIAALLNLPTTARAADAEAVPAALAALGVMPRANVTGGRFLTQLRHTDEGRILLVYNTAREHVMGRIDIDTEGTLTELDLWTGTVSAVAAQLADGRTRATLTFAPLGVRVLYLDARRSVPVTSAPVSAASTRDLAARSWSLSVQAHGPGTPTKIDLPEQGPADWRTVAQLEGVSGIGVYTVAVHAERGDRVGVDLGELEGSAVIRAGGREFGPVYVSDSVVDLGDSLALDPVVQIEVRTTLRNAAITHGILDPHHSPSRTTGLIGPVRFFAST